MQSAPFLRSNQSQITQLVAFCEAYRAHLWQHVPPSPERNQALRFIQALEGKLAKVQDQGANCLYFPFSQEEKNVIQQQLTSLLNAYGGEPQTETRNQKLEEMVNLRFTLNGLHPQALSSSIGEGEFTRPA